MFALTLTVHPEEAGSVTGAGSYKQGVRVSITASHNEGWEFVNWTGDTDHIDEQGSASTYVTMPAHNISLTAIFYTFTCGDSITFNYRGGEVIYGTILRSGLCWMDRNLGADPLPFVPAEDATGNTDTRLYGDLFQWGRLDDGHQARHSNTITGPVD